MEIGVFAPTCLTGSAGRVSSTAFSAARPGDQSARRWPRWPTSPSRPVDRFGSCDHVIFPSFTGSRIRWSQSQRHRGPRPAGVRSARRHGLARARRKQRVRPRLDRARCAVRNPLVTASSSRRSRAHRRAHHHRRWRRCDGEDSRRSTHHTKPGAVTDEYIRLMRELWTSDSPSFDGEHYKLKPGCSSCPSRARHDPHLIGGNTNSRCAHGRLAMAARGLPEPRRDPRQFAPAARHDRRRGTDPQRDAGPSCGSSSTTRSLPDRAPGRRPGAKVVDDIARMAARRATSRLAMPPGRRRRHPRAMHRFVQDVRPQLPSVH